MCVGYSQLIVSRSKYDRWNNKTSGKKLRGIYSALEVGKDFLNRVQRALKENTEKLDYIKVRNVCLSKDTVNGMSN